MFFVMRALQATADNVEDSQRDKRFQSSYCAEVGARTNDMGMILFFALVPANCQLGEVTVFTGMISRFFFIFEKIKIVRLSRLDKTRQYFYLESGN